LPAIGAVSAPGRSRSLLAVPAIGLACKGGRDLLLPGGARSHRRPRSDQRFDDRTSRCTV